MLTKDEKAELAAAYKTHETDTGSTGVQVALLTERIRQLTEELQKLKQIDMERRPAAPPP